MKSQKKRTNKKDNISGNVHPPRYSSNLDDLGLEPPKIYRDSKGQFIDGNYNFSSGRKRENTLTRKEKHARDSKKRKKKNAFRKVLIWLAAIAVLFSIGTVLSLTVFFDINNITVSGSEKYSKSEILAQCTIDKGENLFISDTNKAKNTIEHNLPYIYNVQIKRKLPDTIEIKVTDAKPAYNVRSEDKTYILMDDRFKVLEIGTQKAQGIKIQKAKIKSAEPGDQILFVNKDMQNCLTELANCVQKNSFKEITAIYSKNISDNYVVYDGRITFRLGNCDNLETKIYKGLAACEKLNETNPTAKGIMSVSSDKSVYFTEE